MLLPDQVLVSVIAGTASRKGLKATAASDSVDKGQQPGIKRLSDCTKINTEHYGDGIRTVLASLTPERGFYREFAGSARWLP